MMCSVWTGSIQLGRIDIPVKAFAARNWRGPRVRLRQLHAGCYRFVGNSRHCPIHGPVGTEEIAKGFAYRPGQVVVLEPAELSAISPAPNTTLVLSAFCPLRRLDPIYFCGRSYYLLPDGPTAQQAYRTVKRAMLEEGVCAVSQIVIRRREHFVAVNPVGRLITLNTLYFGNSVRSAAMFPQEAAGGPIPAGQLQATKNLIRARMADRPQFDEHLDPYDERLRELIETKIANGQVIDLAQCQQAVTNRRIGNATPGPRQPLGRHMRVPPAKGITMSQRQRRRSKPA